MHNVYGMLNSRATYEGLLKLAPDRAAVRADARQLRGRPALRRDVDGRQHLELGSPASVDQRCWSNLGLSGFAYVGRRHRRLRRRPALGRPADALDRGRRLQSDLPRPLRQRRSQRRKCGSTAPEHEAIRRRYIEERYRLMPYIYALAEENSRSGLPMMRPVFLEFPSVAGQIGDNSGRSQTSSCSALTC